MENSFKTLWEKYKEKTIWYIDIASLKTYMRN